MDITKTRLKPKMLTLRHHTTFINSSISLSIVIFSCCCLIQITLTMPTAEFEVYHLENANDEPNFPVITEDVIPDRVENTTQKVIRVNLLDLPPIRDDHTVGSEDSNLYEIKALLPPHRTYVNSKRMRRPKQPRVMSPKQMNDANDSGDSPILRRRPKLDGKFQKPKHQQAHKKKQLHFLYNQEALDGRTVGKRMRVHISPGAYPVYYAVSKSNGRFGKFPIKGFRNERDFQKYLVKSKLEPIALKDRFESNSST